MGVPWKLLWILERILYKKNQKLQIVWLHQWLLQLSEIASQTQRSKRSSKTVTDSKVLSFLVWSLLSRVGVSGLRLLKLLTLRYVQVHCLKIFNASSEKIKTEKRQYKEWRSNTLFLKKKPDILLQKIVVTKTKTWQVQSRHQQRRLFKRNKSLLLLQLKTQ